MQLSMMEAYTIEALKKKGETYESFIPKFKQGILEEEAQGLVALAEKDSNTLKKAFDGEYQISFVTLNGLRNLINMRFDIPLDSYTVEANGIFNVKIDETVEKQIRSFLSINWTVERSGETVSFYVKGR